jgi:hypothetical protein
MIIIVEEVLTKVKSSLRHTKESKESFRGIEKGVPKNGGMALRTTGHKMTRQLLK